MGGCEGQRTMARFAVSDTERSGYSRNAYFLRSAKTDGQTFVSLHVPDRRRRKLPFPPAAKCASAARLTQHGQSRWHCQMPQERPTQIGTRFKDDTRLDCGQETGRSLRGKTSLYRPTQTAFRANHNSSILRLRCIAQRNSLDSGNTFSLPPAFIRRQTCQIAEIFCRPPAPLQRH